MTYPLLHDYALADGVKAFSTTRHGGVSKGSYTSFNINHYCGDDEAAIGENQKRLCALLDIPKCNLIYPHQTHQTEVRAIDTAFLSLPEAERGACLEGVDAVMTDIRGVCIGVSTADCIPILFYDSRHHAVAAIHAGWRGTVASIVRKAAAAMHEAYGSEMAECKAVIGPGISLRQFEVGDEVYEAFSEAGFAMDAIAQRMPSSCLADGRVWKWHLDLPECNRRQLVEAGVAPEHITTSDICTFEQCEDFFSARRLGIQSGRIFTGIMIR